MECVLKCSMLTGVIINFEAHAEHLPETVKSEVFFKRAETFKRSSRFRNDGFVDRLVRLEVSTDFDVKELIARNFAGVIGESARQRDHASVTQSLRFQ